MQSLKLVIVFISSTLLNIFLSNHIKLTENKKGQDFKVKEYCDNFNIRNFCFRYFLILNVVSYILVYNVNLEIGIFYIILSFTLVLTSIIDMKYMIIPDIASIVIVITAIAKLTISFSIQGLISAVLGLIIGILPIFLVDFLCVKIFKKDGFGYGDLKLLGSLGLFLGFESICIILVLSIFISALYAIIHIIYNLFAKRKEEYFAYGPFISLSTIIVIFFSSPKIIEMFMNLIDKIVI